MSFKYHAIGNFRHAMLGLLTIILIAGCSKVEETPIKTPRMTMDLPISLSAIVTAAEEASTTQSKASQSQITVARSSDVPTDLTQCEKYLDKKANFMENGYNMTRFLVGLSQQQSCFADFIMNAMVSQGTAWINKGRIALPANPNDPEGPSHLQIVRSDEKVQVWLYFGTSGTDLPADTSTVQTLYLTWSGIDDDVTGKFYMINMPETVADPDGPLGVRVDFVRTATTADNKIYFQFRDTHSAKLAGFRIDVSQVGPDATATYYAKGLVTFSEQPFADLPATLSLPNLTASAVVDSAGLGASVANFNNFGVTLKADGNNDGFIDTAINEFDLGAYQFDIIDKAYFDPSRNNTSDTTTSYIDQVTEWRYKTTSNAIYVSENPRKIPFPSGPLSIFNCMEGSVICDYNANGTLDTGEWMGWGLGVGYLTDTCMDDATLDSNCDAFVSKMLEDGTFGSMTLNSTTAEPTDDWRSAALDDLTQLTTVNPEDDITGATAFNIPEAPVN